MRGERKHAALKENDAGSSGKEEGAVVSKEEGGADVGNRWLRYDEICV